MPLQSSRLETSNNGILDPAPYIRTVKVSIPSGCINRVVSAIARKGRYESRSAGDMASKRDSRWRASGLHLKLSMKELGLLTSKSCKFLRFFDNLNSSSATQSPCGFSN